MTASASILVPRAQEKEEDAPGSIQDPLGQRRSRCRRRRPRRRRPVSWGARASPSDRRCRPYDGGRGHCRNNEMSVSFINAANVRQLTTRGSSCHCREEASSSCPHDERWGAKTSCEQVNLRARLKTTHMMGSSTHSGWCSRRWSASAGGF